MIKITKVTGYCCPNKYLVTQNGVPLCFVNSKNHASECIQYVQGFVEEYNVKMNDGKVLNILRNARKEYLLNQSNDETYSVSMSGIKKDGKLLGILKSENVNIEELTDLSLQLASVVSEHRRREKYGTLDVNEIFKKEL
jgi:hypothetical protein